MIKFKNQYYHLQFKTKFFVLCVLLFLLCLVLGAWQIHRYHYKKILMAEFQNNAQSSAVPIVTLNDIHLVKPFQLTTARGQYLNERPLLVQNRYYQDQLGYEVLTPFRILGEKKLLLVDRGWMAGLPHATLPMAPIVTGTYEIQGRAKLLDEYQFILGKNILSPDKWPIVMQKIDLIELQKITHYNFFPFILRLDAEGAGALPREWRVTSVTPERHLAYAIQWFIMAIVLCIAYCCYGIERVEGESCKRKRGSLF